MIPHNDLGLGHSSSQQQHLSSSIEIQGQWYLCGYTIPPFWEYCMKHGQYLIWVPIWGMFYHGKWIIGITSASNHFIAIVTSKPVRTHLHTTWTAPCLLWTLWVSEPRNRVFSGPPSTYMKYVLPWEMIYMDHTGLKTTPYPLSIGNLLEPFERHLSSSEPPCGQYEYPSPGLWCCPVLQAPTWSIFHHWKWIICITLDSKHFIAILTREPVRAQKHPI